MGKLRKKTESGQAIVEYIILLSIVVGVVAFILPKLSKGFDVANLSIGGKMEAQLRTGKAPASLWVK